MDLAEWLESELAVDELDAPYARGLVPAAGQRGAGSDRVRCPLPQKISERHSRTEPARRRVLGTCACLHHTTLVDRLLDPGPPQRAILCCRVGRHNAHDTVVAGPALAWRCSGMALGGNPLIRVGLPLPVWCDPAWWQPGPPCLSRNDRAWSQTEYPVSSPGNQASVAASVSNSPRPPCSRSRHIDAERVCCRPPSVRPSATHPL